MTGRKQPRRKPYAPQRTPPPLAHTLGAEGFPGREILEEFASVPGLLLWTCYRDADLWVRATERGHLFSEEPGAPTLIEQIAGPEYLRIIPALRVISGVVSREASDPMELAPECETIAEWAEQQSKLATAVEYAQLASLAAPTNPLYAVRTGRVLKMRAEWARAQSWFDHAVFLARLTGNFGAYAAAYSGLGSLHLERGNLPKAKRMLMRSLRIAKRNHLRERAAVVYHNLLAIEYLAGNWSLAEAHAVKALKLYPDGSPNRPRLARDLAYRTILRGAFSEALPLSQEVLRHFSAPADRALVWSDIARAAGGALELEKFEQAWAQAYLLIETENLDPFTINVLLNLAHGAASRGDSFRAGMMAKKAVELARTRRESGSVFEGEALLDSLHTTKPLTLGRPTPTRSSEVVIRVFLQTLEHQRAVG